MTHPQQTTREVLAALPCPFCGHIGLDYSEGSTFRWVVAECAGCGATHGETRVQTFGEGSKDEWMADAREDAIREWNTHAAIANPTREVLEQAYARALNLHNDHWRHWSDDDIASSNENLSMFRAALAQPTLSTTGERDDWDARGILASKLTCWHRLTEEESDELAAILASARSQPTTEESLVVAGAQPEREPLTEAQWDELAALTGCESFTRIGKAAISRILGITKKA